MGRQASSQASWALLTEGVTAAKLEAHRLRHLINRAMKLVASSPEREHLYQIAGDIISAIPERLDRLDTFLDRVSYTLSKMGQEFYEARLSLSDKLLVDEAIESSSAAQRVAAKYYSRRTVGQ